MHIGDFTLEVVRVLVSLAITYGLHQAGGRIAQMQGNGVGGGLFHVFIDRVKGDVERVRFRSQCQINGSLGQCQVAFRNAEKIHGITGGDGLVQRLGICQSNIFYRHAHQAPRYVERIFP